MLEKNASPFENRKICLPATADEYDRIVCDPKKFRQYLDNMISKFPELFPHDIQNGYTMKDIYTSKKLGLKIRRISVGKVSYTIRPSFVMPHMTGTVDDVEKALFLRKFSVPFWALACVFGKNPMYWHRIEQSIGRNSIVGTTIRNSDDIPEHIAADEKHTKLLGKKVYAATTVGEGCILGASIAEDAGEESLTKAYSVFKEEVQCIHPEFQPVTVNTDGWKATQKAWALLFQTTVIIGCFLHVFIKIRGRAKKNMLISSETLRTSFGIATMLQQSIVFVNESGGFWNGPKTNPFLM